MTREHALPCFSGLTYIAPSGVQKERVEPEDLFVFDASGKEIAGVLARSIMNEWVRQANQ